jgi:hypothetical protein
MDKLPTYYRRNQYSGLESMLVMMQNNIAQKRIVQQLDVR